MAYSKEAREAAALARKIKSRLGVKAYELWKKTGVVPAGLDDKPKSGKSKEAYNALAAAGRADTLLADAARRTKVARTPRSAPPSLDPSVKTMAETLPVLSDPNFLRAMSTKGRKPAAEKLRSIAAAQAQLQTPNEKWVSAYTDLKIFAMRGYKPEAVADARDRFWRGDPIPIWAAPPGTPVAVYRSETSAVPDFVGQYTGVVRRPLLEESGRKMLKEDVPYLRFRADDGSTYEYPALMGGGSNSAQVRFASFAATEAIDRGLTYVPAIGWGRPNFSPDDDAGPGEAPESIDLMAKNIQRALSWAEATARRRAAKEAAAKEQG